MLGRRLWIALVLGLLLSVCPPMLSTALATAIAVTTTADELTTNTQCSLREAIVNSNTISQQFPDCPAGTGTDTITLPGGTIQLAIAGRDEEAGLTGDLDITRTVTIQGQGAAASRIVGGGSATVALDRLFDVRPAASLTLRGVGVGFGSAGAAAGTLGGAIVVQSQSTLTLEDAEVFESFADAGGGIAIESGTATLNRTTVRGNSAATKGGGIASLGGGTVTIQSSTIRNNAVAGGGTNGGGGIHSSGAGPTLTITNSTISANLALVHGAGVQAQGGTVVMTGSTVDGNLVDPFPGGAGIGDGAGVLLQGADSTIVNSTISGNRFGNVVNGLGGGLRIESGLLEIVQSTVAFNQSKANGGGGLNLASGAVVTVRGTIVANNVDSTAPGTFDNCEGTVDVSESNLTGSAPGDDDCGFVAATDLRRANPQLGPLQNNGGPTFTHAIPSNSLAVDRIQAILVTGQGLRCVTYDRRRIFVDQRGSPRGVDGNGDGTARCDIGAFELAGGGTGITDFRPAEATVIPGEPIVYTFPWEVPAPKNWHDLSRLELRVRDGSGTAFHLRWNEAENTFQLVNPGGSLGPAFSPGSSQVLQTPYASLSLAGASVQGSGPTGPLVTLTLPITFTDRAAGRTFTIEALAVEDSGAQQGFDPVGRVTVGVAAATTINDPNNDKDGKADKDKPLRLTEEQRQQKERTNRAGLDDYRTEGNAVSSRCDLSPPEVDIANRDGTVTLLLLGDTATQCRSVDPGEYVEAEGVKLHEQRYEVDSLTVRNR